MENNSDPNASPNEKIDIQTAQQITETAKVIVDGFKIKTQAMHILSKAENANKVMMAFNESGITDNPKAITNE